MVKLIDITYKDETIEENSLYIYQDYGYDEQGDYYRANAWHLMLNKNKIHFEMFKNTMLNYAHDYAINNNIENVYIKHAREGR